MASNIKKDYYGSGNYMNDKIQSEHKTIRGGGEDVEEEEGKRRGGRGGGQKRRRRESEIYRQMR